MSRGIYKSKNRKGGIKGRSGVYLRTQKHREINKQSHLGRKHPHKGRKWSDISRLKLSTTNKGKKGYWKGKIRLNFRAENHPNWQGGISFEPYSVDWTETLRRSIRERDHYICQLCNQYGNAVHHKDYDKKNCDPINLITLCKKCNNKVNFNRQYWQHFFDEKNSLRL